MIEVGIGFSSTEWATLTERARERWQGKANRGIDASISCGGQERSQSPIDLPIASKKLDSECAKTGASRLPFMVDGRTETRPSNSRNLIMASISASQGSFAPETAFSRCSLDASVSSLEPPSQARM